MCMHMSVYMHLYLGAIKGHKRMPDVLELELQAFVSCLTGAENQIWVPCKNTKLS